MTQAIKIRRLAAERFDNLDIPKHMTLNKEMTFDHRKIVDVSINKINNNNKKKKCDRKIYLIRRSFLYNFERILLYILLGTVNEKF